MKGNSAHYRNIISQTNKDIEREKTAQSRAATAKEFAALQALDTPPKFGKGGKSIAACMHQRSQLQKTIADMGDTDKFTDLEAKAFDALVAEFDELSAHIQKLEENERKAASAAVPVEELYALGGSMNIERQRDTKDVSAFAAYCVAIAAGQGHLEQAVNYADSRLGMPEVSAALQSSVPSGGGYLVPNVLSNEIIEFLRSDSACRALGARVVRMDSGNLSMPKMISGTVASYGAEGANIGKTEPQFGEVKLIAKKLTALTPISNDLVRRANMDALRVVQDDLIAAIGEREDLAFIRGDGSSNSPVGLINLMDAANKLAATGSGSITDISTDLKRLDTAIMDKRVKLKGNVGYILSPRSYNHLTELRDAQGNRLYPEVMEMKLRGRPIAISHQIPTNLGAGTNETEIYLGVFDQLVIGDALAFHISLSESAYHDGSNVVSAFSRDETVIRIIAEHDIALRHSGAFAMLQGVKW